VQQIITISADGTVSGLQRKPGQGIDLRQLGHADIKRASLIEWDEAAQAWFVDVLQDAGKGRVTRSALRTVFSDYEIGELVERYRPTHPSGWMAYVADMTGNDDPTLMSDDYDAMVKVEVAFLDALRIKGEF
jgi:hypothetical protein